MKIELSFHDIYSIAETAARVLFEEHPRRQEPITGLTDAVQSNLRSMARRAAVATLRKLWSDGDAEARQTVATRVRLWCLGSRQFDVRASVQDFITAREKARRKDGSLPARFCRRPMAFPA